jgi:hypothetical protein
LFNGSELVERWDAGSEKCFRPLSGPPGFDETSDEEEMLDDDVGDELSDEGSGKSLSDDGVGEA